jgi:hypothetical protein
MDTRMHRLRVLVLILSAITLTSALAGQGFRRAASMILLQLQGTPVAASAGRISEHELEEIDNMSPQDQAERLLERAINHYAGATDKIAKRAEGWTGQIHSSKKLENMTDTAYFSIDLRVRAVALEIWLARDNLHQNAGGGRRTV